MCVYIYIYIYTHAYIVQLGEAALELLARDLALVVLALRLRMYIAHSISCIHRIIQYIIHVALYSVFYRVYRIGSVLHSAYCIFSEFMDLVFEDVVSDNIYTYIYI